MQKIKWANFLQEFERHFLLLQTINHRSRLQALPAYDTVYTKHLREFIPDLHL